MIADFFFFLFPSPGQAFANLKHLHNVDARIHGPQTFLSLDVQCRDDISGLTRAAVQQLSLQCILLLMLLSSAKVVSAVPVSMSAGM